MIIAVHQPQYLPWLGYFAKMQQSDGFVFLDCVQYKEREFQNRNKIRTKDGWMWLTVPVVSKGLRGQLISQVQIDNSVDWQEEHWKSLKAWYGKAEFFKQYSAFFEDIYTVKKWDKLVDFNLCIIKYLTQELGIDTPIYLESEIGTTQASTERIVEICLKLKADTYFSGSGGRQYLDEEKFRAQKIKLAYQDYAHPQYRQCYEPFMPFMATIDLLFNHGKKALKIILHS